MCSFSLPSVAIELANKSRALFIVAEIYFLETKEKRLVIKSLANAARHKHILEALKLSLKGKPIEITCIGGGMLDISINEHTIQVSGASTEYKMEPDRNKTVEMIANWFRRYRVSKV